MSFSFDHAWISDAGYPMLDWQSQARREKSVEPRSFEVVVDLPAAGAATGGIVWSDPCVSSRHVVCEATKFDAYGKSVEMLNALLGGGHDDVHTAVH